MSTQEIANKLAAYCRKADWETAQKELYAQDAISIEPAAMGPFEKETKGLDAILEKGKKFEAMVEEHYGTEVSEPIVAGNSIAFKLAMDVKMKGQERMSTPELCVYNVKDGKIVKEEFFV